MGKLLTGPLEMLCFQRTKAFDFWFALSHDSADGRVNDISDAGLREGTTAPQAAVDISRRDATTQRPRERALGSVQIHCFSLERKHR